MTKYLVDSDVCIAVLKQARHALLKSELASRLSEGVAMSVITFGEVAEGVYFSQHRAVAMQRWHELLSPLEVVDVTREIAEIWADLRGSLRRRGLIVADNDLLIGSTAIRHDLTVYTRNARHFSRINGLKVEVARDDE